MRIAFAGTPEFAAAALAALIDTAPRAGWTLALVLSQPDRPAGRGLKLAACPVKQLALGHGLPVITPLTLSLKRGGAEAQVAHDALRAAAVDVLIVAAYGLILPQAVLDIPRGLQAVHAGNVGVGALTALNIHASLLPRWRGAAPIARAVEAGDATTGITIMQMDAGLDTGPMLLEAALPIAPDDTAGSLTARLAQRGGALLLQALHDAARGALRARPQPAAAATYAHKLDKREAWLDFTQSAVHLARQVRAFDPFPVACAQWRGTPVKLWRAEAVAAPPAEAVAGTVLAADARGVRIACGEGVLNVTELQRAGGKRLPAREFLAGFALVPGERCEPPPAALAAASA